MLYKNNVYLVVVLVSVLTLTSCAMGKLDKIVGQVQPTEALLINDKGKFTIVDTKTGAVIVNCKQREKTKSPCRGYKNGEVISSQEVKVIDWKINPYCRTIIIGGDEYERCY